MYKEYVKRILDIILSFIGILILWPLFIIISILIKIDDRGPVFYSKERTGLHGNNFKMYKFRTMNNKQVTKIGKLLRTTSLDEIPQLLNILKGDMSFIGPRPWIPEYYKRFNENQKRRVEIRPGMLGLAQVNGRNKINIFKKIEYDIYYVDNVSFLLDIKILMKSFKVVIVHEDINNIEEHLNKELELLQGETKKM